jgi:hypothetical protein
MFAVMLGVVAAGLGVVLFRVAGVAMGTVGMMRRLLMIAGFVMLGGFAMMFRRMLVVFGGLVMVLNACVVAHVSLPVRDVKTRRRCTQAV